MTFRDNEKARYHTLKCDLFSADAQGPGSYQGKPRPFCLADGHSAENLHASIRDEALAYFRQRGITWHDGCPDDHGNPKAIPSKHLCCSQSACVNALAPMMRDRCLLHEAFGEFLPDIEEVLPFEADAPLPDGSQPFLAFEWIGTQNYLGEVGNRRRGANATSADFAFRFRRHDGRIQLVLGEWKYTEFYTKQLPQAGDLNKTQLRVYHEAFDMWRRDQAGLPPYEAFFVEPFYQLMRQALLAQVMERSGGQEMGADVVTVLHVAPKANNDFAGGFTSSTFQGLGHTVTEAWKSLCSYRFSSIASEDLFTAIEKASGPNHRPWAQWLLKRYGWWHMDGIRNNT